MVKTTEAKFILQRFWSLVMEGQGYAQACYDWQEGPEPRFYTGLVEAVKALGRAILHDLFCGRLGHDYLAEIDPESGAEVGYYCSRCGISPDLEGPR